MAIKEHMSKSQYRDWMTCPAREMAVQRGEYPPKETTLSMLLGSYVDAQLTQGIAGKDWIEQLPEEQQGLFLRKDKKPVSEVAKADKLTERIQNDEVASALFPKDVGQVELACEIGGVTWKCRLDVCLPELGMFVELKVKGQIKPQWIRREGRNVKVPWYHDYWDEMSVYWEACRQNYQQMDGYLVAGLLADTPALRAIEFSDEEDIQNKLQEVALNTQKIQDWKNDEEEPPPCRELDCAYCNEKLPLQVEKAVAAL